MLVAQGLKPVAEYRLTRQEVARGALGGFRRWMKSEHLKNRAGYKPSPYADLASAANGAIAEVAAAKWLGIPLSRLKIHEGQFAKFVNGEKWKAPDLDPNFEVRWSSGTGLIVRPHEDILLDRKFILVTNNEPGVHQIWGWALGRNIWKPKFISRPKKDRDECYEMPKHLLIRSIP